MTKLPIWQLSWEALNHWRFIKSSNSHHNNLSSFSNSTFEVWIQEEVFLSSVRKKLITWHRADLHVTWTPFQWLLLISDIWPLIQNFTLKQLNSLRFLFSFIEKLRTPEKKLASNVCNELSSIERIARRSCKYSFALGCVSRANSLVHA